MQTWYVDPDNAVCGSTLTSQPVHFSLTFPISLYYERMKGSYLCTAEYLWIIQGISIQQSLLLVYTDLSESKVFVPGFR